MNINTFIDTLTAALVVDSAITTWATAQYSSGFNVFENVDMRNPPDADDCPMILVSHGSKSGGLNQGNKSLTIGVDVLVHDDRITTTAAGVVRYEGGRQAEACRQLVMDVITDVLPADTFIESVATSFDTINQFPFIFVAMDIVLTQEKLIGGDPYE